jgi:hypothetical protein
VWTHLDKHLLVEVPHAEVKLLVPRRRCTFAQRRALALALAQFYAHESRITHAPRQSVAPPQVERLHHEHLPNSAVGRAGREALKKQPAGNPSSPVVQGVWEKLCIRASSTDVERYAGNILIYTIVAIVTNYQHHSVSRVRAMRGVNTLR